MTAITEFGIIGLVIVAFTLGLVAGIFLAMGAVQLIARIIWHLWIMSRAD